MLQEISKSIIQQIRNLFRACLTYLLLKAIEHNKAKTAKQQQSLKRVDDIFYAYKTYRLIATKKMIDIDIVPTPTTPPVLRSFKRSTEERKQITNTITFGGVEEYGLVLKAKKNSNV